MNATETIQHNLRETIVVNISKQYEEYLSTLKETAHIGIGDDILQFLHNLRPNMTPNTKPSLREIYELQYIDELCAKVHSIHTKLNKGKDED